MPTSADLPTTSADNSVVQSDYTPTGDDNDEEDIAPNPDADTTKERNGDYSGSPSPTPSDDTVPSSASDAPKKSSSSSPIGDDKKEEEEADKAKTVYCTDYSCPDNYDLVPHAECDGGICGDTPCCVALSTEAESSDRGEGTVLCKFVASALPWATTLPTACLWKMFYPRGGAACQAIVPVYLYKKYSFHGRAR